MRFDRRRRQTLGALLSGAAVSSPLARAAAAVAIGPPPGPPSASRRPVVAHARRDGLIGDGDAFVVSKLADGLGAAIARAAGEKTPVEALRRLFRPTDVVGIKVNCIAGRGLSTRPEVALLIGRWLREAGVPERSVVIWDRNDRELRNAGFTINRSGGGVRILGTNEEYDPKVREWGPSASMFARILIDDLTAMINLPVLKEHGLAGLSLGLKNWYGAVHNPNKLHADGCQPFIPHLAACPLIKDKLRLTIIDGSIGQCHGGPSRSPRWAWPHHGFLASLDPVAIDAVGWRILEARRIEVGLGTLAQEHREPSHIAMAARLGLGVAEPDRILLETA